ncbi:MAG TPA: chemotaxis protein CheB [Gemmatimonadaceae bacterium]|nr:chemotaxis protein CheB [Gemmatimonadaceae bacterium]
MGAYGLVAIIGSAGAHRGLIEILGALPADFPLPIAVMVHLAPTRASHLVEIFRRVVQLGVRSACDGDVLKPGTIYVAIPDWHMGIGPAETVALTQGPRRHFVRPSGDSLFETAAVAYGPRLIAVVLTGLGRDGAEGVRSVKDHNGLVIVEDPSTALHDGMPLSALATGRVDVVVPRGEIAPALRRRAGMEYA